MWVLNISHVYGGKTRKGQTLYKHLYIFHLGQSLISLSIYIIYIYIYTFFFYSFFLQALLTGLIAMCPENPHQFIIEALLHIKEKGLTCLEW